MEINTYKNTAEKKTITVRRGSGADLALDSEKAWKRTKGSKAGDDDSGDGVAATTGTADTPTAADTAAE